MSTAYCPTSPPRCRRSPRVQPSLEAPTYVNSTNAYCPTSPPWCRRAPATGLSSTYPNHITTMVSSLFLGRQIARYFHALTCHSPHDSVMPASRGGCCRASVLHPLPRQLHHRGVVVVLGFFMESRSRGRPPLVTSLPGNRPILSSLCASAPRYLCASVLLHLPDPTSSSTPPNPALLGLLML